MRPSPKVSPGVRGRWFGPEANPNPTNLRRIHEKAGLNVDDGVLVDGRLQTSNPDVYSAGDIARFPDAMSNRRIRIEHWVVAGRQGRTAARNMVGRSEPFRDVPFFWTSHFEQSIAYVGHADRWDDATLVGDCGSNDCAVTFSKNGKPLALATIGRNEESLKTEADWETEREDRLQPGPSVRLVNV